MFMGILRSRCLYFILMKSDLGMRLPLFSSQGMWSLAELEGELIS